MKKVDHQKIIEDIKGRINIELKDLKESVSVSLISISSSRVGKSFIKSKMSFGDKVRIPVNLFEIDPKDDTEVIRLSVRRIIDESDSTVVQLPIPKKLDRDEILNLIPPEKDPDMLSGISRERFFECKSFIIPPVAGAVKEILSAENVYFKDKKIVVIGKGRLVGAPVSCWFACNGVIPRSLDEGDDLSLNLRDADIVVSGAGVSGLVKPEMIKEGVVLIDAGTSGQSGQVVGDIDENCREKASVFTPVPGGVGPIAVARLFLNVVRLRAGESASK